LIILLKDDDLPEVTFLY